jgi:ADP-ribose pyrophosphatase YjhB (NUDIX family)
MLLNPATAMPDSTIRPILAASAAVFRGGRVLIARRAKPPHLWSLPGGAVEAGEMPAQAAARELREETGIDAEIVAETGEREVKLRDKSGAVTAHYVIHAFAARWRAGEARPGLEASAVEWIAPEALGRFETTEGLAEIVAAARRILGS